MLFMASNRAENPLEKSGVDPNALVSYKSFEISGVAQDVQVWSDEASLPQFSGQYVWMLAMKLSHTPKEKRPWSN